MRKVINKIGKLCINNPLNLLVTIAIIGIGVFTCFLRDVIKIPENWSVDNFLDAISIFLAIIGGFFAYHQWSYSNKTSRIELLVLPQIAVYKHKGVW